MALAMCTPHICGQRLSWCLNMIAPLLARRAGVPQISTMYSLADRSYVLFVIAARKTTAQTTVGLRKDHRPLNKSTFLSSATFDLYRPTEDVKEYNQRVGSSSKP